MYALCSAHTTRRPSRNPACRQTSLLQHAHPATRYIDPLHLPQLSHILTHHPGIPHLSSDQPELNDILSTMRTKHFVPGYLDRPTQRLIFAQKNRQTLLDNPQSVEIGGEEFPLVWMDRHHDIPNRTKLLKQALSLMESKEDWANLPGILVALKHMKSVPREWFMEYIVRKVIDAGRLPVLVRCLQQSEHTGVTLKRKEVLRYVIFGLHDHAARGGWSAESVKEALGLARNVSNMLESEAHGTGERMLHKDPRRRPEVIGVFLELAAVNAQLHQNGEDRGDAVKAYTSRLLSCMDESSRQPSGLQPPASGPAWEMLEGAPIWHGLALAQKVLGSKMENAQEVGKIAADYEAGLENLCKSIEAQKPKEGSYGAQAVRVWRECTRE